MGAQRTKDAPKFSAIIVAAGTGSRMGADLPKQFLPLGTGCNKKPLWRWSVDVMLAAPNLQNLCLVINASYRAEYEKECPSDPRIILAEGGSSRTQSVCNGVEALNSILHPAPITLIHDAARPFLQLDQVQKALRTMKEDQAVMTFALPITETLRRSEPQTENAADVVDRENLWAIQTPQIFKHDALVKSFDYWETKKNSADFAPTDETQLASATGFKVTFFRGTRDNIKITTADDMTFADKILKTHEQNTPQPDIRVGSGFDVHRFDIDRSVDEGAMLCGIHIPNTHPLKGHSDADVALHALVDAMLGAISAGDIGDHFPPTNPKWKGANSDIFVQEALRLIDEKNGQILNIDLTLICETPKISPYKNAMRRRLSEMCNITEDRINVKATTTEGLGFTGRKEGIAASAQISLAL